MTYSISSSSPAETNLEERHLEAETIRMAAYSPTATPAPAHLQGPTGLSENRHTSYFLPSIRINTKWNRNLNVKDETTQK